jgi:hypothetical protein
MTKFKAKDAKFVMDKLNLKIKNFKFTLGDLAKGMNVELEHGEIRRLTNVTNNDRLMTGKIALAHLLELPDYYKRLEKMEKD